MAGVSGKVAAGVVAALSSVIPTAAVKAGGVLLSFNPIKKSPK